MATEIEVLNMRDFDRTTQVMIRAGDVAVGMSVNDVKKWIEPNAPDHEVVKFLLTCQSAGLNPFLSQAYLVNIGGKWGTIVGKYGYLDRAQRHRNQDGELDYNGHESGITIMEQVADARGNPVAGRTRGLPIEIEGKIVPPGHLLVGGWAKVWRKGIDRPIKASVGLSEYYKPSSPTWKSMTTTMIAKCALVAAIRETFAIGDSYDISEAEPTTRYVPREDGGPGPMKVEARVVETVASPGGLPQIERMYDGDDDPICPPELVGRILELKAELGMSDGKLDGILMKWGYGKLTQMTPNDASTLIVRLEEFASRPKFVNNDFPDGKSGKDGRSVAHGGSVPLDREAVVNGSGGPEGGGQAVAVLEVTEAATTEDGADAGAYASIPTGGPDED